MTVVLELKPELEEAIKKKAAAAGSSVNGYLEELVRKEIHLDEILAPVRKQFEDTGMTEDELDDFFSGIRRKSFEERYPNGRP